VVKPFDRTQGRLFGTSGTAETDFSFEWLFTSKKPVLSL
jgi:hypothetical protein